MADACDVIFGTRKQCGLNWDEGPDKDGGCGPAMCQSERRALHMQQYPHSLWKAAMPTTASAPTRLWSSAVRK